MFKIFNFGEEPKPKFKEVQLVNCTPHPINMYVGEKLVLTGNTGKVVVRIESEVKTVMDIPIGETGEEFPLVEVVAQTIVPEMPVVETPYKLIYVVSRIVAEFARREDFVYPDDLIKYENGTVIGCRRFGMYK